MIFVILASLVSISTLAQTSPPELPTDNDPAGPGSTGEEADWQVNYHLGTNKVRFLNTKSGAAIQQPGFLSPAATIDSAALNFLTYYGEMFGLSDPADQLAVMKTSTLGDAAAGEVERSFVRFQQVHADIPVMGGELIVQMDAHKNVFSINGEVLPNLNLVTTPSINAETARQTALAKVAKDYGMGVTDLTTSQPELWVYNPVLLGGPGPRFDTLVWRMEVESVELLPILSLAL
jgi:Zn-dependent metalloprotease